MTAPGPRCVVVGAGVVGLACAYALARRGAEVIVLERHRRIASETSARNSGVIHAGLYYPSGSLKAKACVEGRFRLYDWCETRKVDCRKIGKLIVATREAELPRLQTLMHQGRENGVEGLTFLTGAEARVLEPQVACVGALLSAETGVIDAAAYALSLQGALEDAGGVIALGAEVHALEPLKGGWRILTTEGDSVEADWVINAAGLFAPDLTRKIEAYPPESLPQARYAKGSYVALSGPPPFSRLVYPLPVTGGLGVHATLDLGGQVRFGPDVEWVDAPDYSLADDLPARFAAAIRPYWPGVTEEALRPDYCGVRPKLAGSLANEDFRIETPAENGLPGLVCLFGIESPGLTASLAIGERVALAMS